MAEGSYYRVNIEAEHRGCPISETTKRIKTIEIDGFPYRIGKTYRDTILVVTPTEKDFSDEILDEVIRSLRSRKNKGVIKSFKVLRQDLTQMILHATIYDRRCSGLIRTFYETKGLLTTPAAPVHSVAGIESYVYWAPSEQLALDAKNLLDRKAKVLDISKPVEVPLAEDILEHSTLFSQIFCDALESNKGMIQELQRRILNGQNIYDKEKPMKISKSMVEEMFSEEKIVKTAVPVLIRMLQSHLMNPETERWIIEEFRDILGFL